MPSDARRATLREDAAASNPTGNARLTGLTGAVLFVLLAAEGVTILRVHSLLSAHVFIGMVLVPVAVLKIVTTGYRFVRYYTGDGAYVAKGAPPSVLRFAGPVVVVSTIAVFATGIALGIAGPGHHQLLQLHKVSFVLWFAVTAIHVLGHLLDTSRLAVADWTRASPVAAGRVVRALLILATLLLGLALGFGTRSWSSAWHHSVLDL